MYKIEKLNFGYKLNFGEFILKEEMGKWYNESVEILKTSPASYGVLIDMRTLKPLPSESQSVLQEGQKKYKECGMVRSAVILNNPLINIQFKCLAKKTCVYEWERYIDTSVSPDWEKLAIDWIEKEIDPDTL